MMFKNITLFIYVFLAMVCLNCADEEVNDSEQYERNPSVNLTKVKIHNIEARVRIPVEGELDAWLQEELTVQKTCKLISLLVEESNGVEKGDLIASALIQYPEYSYQPVNLRAPFNSIVSRIYYNVGDTIQAHKPIVELKNFEQMHMTAEKKDAQMQYIEEDQNVTLFFGSDTINGFVKQTDRRKNRVVLSSNNSALKYHRDLQVKGHIHIGYVRGSFIRAHHFKSPSSSIILETDNRISFTATFVGFADTLAFIHPPIPDQNYLWLLQKKLDL
ncbi:MAG: HlyD family efflux transporter periplasmic adaptor subunit [Caldithrix sp.]|nr:HlyD family efflux transporter periplasmic adaptor subunit [Caldithrix sp.]